MNSFVKTLEGEKFGKVQKEKLLGIVIDRNLCFDEYILSQCKKADRKLSMLVRIFKFMTIERRGIFTKSSIESWFGYCPLVWMCVIQVVIIAKITCMSER